MKIVAKPLNSCSWILQQSGKKVGNIHVTDNGVSVTHQGATQFFPNLTSIAKEYQIEFETYQITKPDPSLVWGFTPKSKPYNVEYDVSRGLPLYTTAAGSKCKRAAGYYAVNYRKHWVMEFCPKLITLLRYKYEGPFVIEQLAQEFINERTESIS